ncbi:4-hydroxybenzoate polyprenyltransferase [Flexistipes sinusarabici DSM 4947]|uniref:4-hydroxybenzoate polyprenyltransferase n=3 Tax=Flexistipes sinusarabici TaxID=2352 RepID=F8E6I0_FLESM|nr:UbiA-like polyprenyltransferase [Flexistipes sinusarabici]AEI14817.1 4-hydroxybenzoate polyprenyltransferase [Flexistipes sinusarabici DSM 4947]
MEKVKTFFRMIKIEHSLFALPFAFTGALLAARGIPSLWKIFWIFVAMVNARTIAMGLNRVVDAEIDSKNPRTADREIPAGKISKKKALLYIVLSLFIYEVATYQLNMLCFILSPVPLIVFVVYSYSKRFTSLCHIILGVALGLAPIGAWVAINGTVNLGIVLLGIAVLLWVAGFDIIYALQDLDFDKSYGLFSVPAKLGIKNSILISRLFHLTAFIIFAYLKVYFGLGILYIAGVILCGLFMLYEHSLIKSDDLSRVNMAFFNMNAYISITIFVFVFLDFLMRGMV